MAIDSTLLTGRAKSGDAEAFGELYEQYAGDMYRYALYVLGSRCAAQDAVQETALAAFRSVRSLRDPASFRPWLFRILANHCKRQLRGKYAPQAESLDELFAEPASADAPLGCALELRQAIAALPQAERDVVFLSVLEGYDSSEIGRILDLRPGTVRSKLSRALAKLRKENFLS